jgi:hypothetical protein
MHVLLVCLENIQNIFYNCHIYSSLGNFTLIAYELTRTKRDNLLLQKMADNNNIGLRARIQRRTIDGLGRAQ